MFQVVVCILVCKGFSDLTVLEWSGKLMLYISLFQVIHSRVSRVCKVRIYLPVALVIYTALVAISYPVPQVSCTGTDIPVNYAPFSCWSSAQDYWIPRQVRCHNCWYYYSALSEDLSFASPRHVLKTPQDTHSSPIFKTLGVGMEAVETTRQHYRNVCLASSSLCIILEQYIVLNYR